MKANTTADVLDEPIEEVIDELLPGATLLQGQYRIERFLNSGGFGITYLALDSLDRKIVIKECFPRAFCTRSNTSVVVRSRSHVDDFKTIVRLFLQEAKSLSKLIHPNIVGVHQVFEDNRTAYMAIDYVDGHDLLQLIDDGKSFRPTEIVTLLQKLLEAVSYVHTEGMLHRDISPDNILISDTGEPILIDFGAARVQAAKASRALSAMRVVKEGYSPQEFYISGSVQGDFSDLYALAASFYHLITGAAPPDSQARLLAIAEERGDPYVKLEGVRGGYPDGFLASIDTALEVLPKDRVQTAEAWLGLIRKPGGAAGTPKLVVLPEPDTSEAMEPAPPATTKAIVDAMAARANADPVEIGGAAVTGAAVDTPAEAKAAPATARAGRTEKVLLGTVALMVLAAGIGAVQWAGGLGDAAVVSESVAAAPAEPAAEDVVIVDAVAPFAIAALEAPMAEPEPTPEADAVPEARADAAAESVQPAPEATAGIATDPTEAAAPAEPEPSTDIAQADAVQTPTVPAQLPQVLAAADADTGVGSRALRLLGLGGPAEPAPAAAPDPVPAQVALSQDQFLETRWFIEMSFRGTIDEGKDATVINIKGVGKSARANPSSDWIAEGTSIFSLNGKKIDGSASIEQLLLETPDLGRDTHVQAPVTYRGADQRVLQDGVLAVPVVRLVTMKCGTTLETKAAGGSWKTVVKSVGEMQPDGLRVGDVLMAEAATGRLLTSSQGFEDIVARLVRVGAPKAAFTVQRADEQLVVALALTPAEQVSVSE